MFFAKKKWKKKTKVGGYDDKTCTPWFEYKQNKTMETYKRTYICDLDASVAFDGEPLLTENPLRFVLFPLQHKEVFFCFVFK